MRGMFGIRQDSNGFLWSLTPTLTWGKGRGGERKSRAQEAQELPHVGRFWLAGGCEQKGRLSISHQSILEQGLDSQLSLPPGSPVGLALRQKEAESLHRGEATPKPTANV